jgi:hypothetical protein
VTAACRWIALARIEPVEWRKRAASRQMGGRGYCLPGCHVCGNFTGRFLVARTSCGAGHRGRELDGCELDWGRCGARLREDSCGGQVGAGGWGCGCGPGEWRDHGRAGGFGGLFGGLPGMGSCTGWLRLRRPMPGRWGTSGESADTDLDRALEWHGLVNRAQPRSGGPSGPQGLQAVAANAWAVGSYADSAGRRR